MLTTETRGKIDAPAAVVWGVMTDFGRYPEWNPFVTEMRCATEARAGSVVELHMRWKRATGKEIISKERFKRLEAPAKASDGVVRGQLSYYADGPLAKLRLVNSYRVQTIEQLPKGGTLYHTRIEISGPVSRIAPMHLILDGFERQLAALKARCEALNAPER